MLYLLVRQYLLYKLLVLYLFTKKSREFFGIALREHFKVVHDAVLFNSVFLILTLPLFKLISDFDKNHDIFKNHVFQSYYDLFQVN